nr:hypothetical protein [Tanacetum cinerariifolium]
MPRKDMYAIRNMVEETLKVVVPEMVDEVTNDNMKKNLPRLVAEGIRLEREKVKADIASMVAEDVRKEEDHTKAELSLRVINDVDTNVPLQVDAFLKNYMNNHILHVHSTESASSSIPDFERDADLPIWLTLKYNVDPKL